MTLDFALNVRSRIERGGFLYQPRCESGEITDRTALSKLVAEIGRKAGVIAEPGENPKFATAKHFRSSFVTRWSLRRMPLERVQKIVRHADIVTTRKYYLGNTGEDEVFDETEFLETVKF